MPRPRRCNLALIASLAMLPCSLAFGAGPSQPETQQSAETVLGFEAGAPGQPPPDWFVPAPGWAAELTADLAVEGRLCVKLSQAAASDAPFGNLMCILDGAPHRGRRVKLTARIRAEGPGDGQAMMWLRADLDDGTVGAFDNMADRPIPAAAPGAGTWSDAVIELDIEPDARQLALGFMSFAGATLFIDAVRLETSGTPTDAPLPQEPSEPRPLSPRGLENLQAATRLLSYVRFFHPSDQASAVNAWDHLAVRVIEEAEPAADAPDLAGRLAEAFEEIAPALEVWAGGPEDAPPLAPPPPGADRVVLWRHFGAGNLGLKTGRPSIYSSEIVREPLPFRLPWGAGGTPDEESHAASFVIKPLGGGVTCRLPVKLYADDDGTLPHAPAETAWSRTDDKPRLTAGNRSTRLAGVALCWGVMQHFYPYFDVVETDWDAALAPALSDAAEDPDGVAYLHTLRELIAKLHDGHGGVYSRSIAPESMLPFAFAWAGDELAIVGKDKSVADEIRIGDVVLAIDGRPVADWYEELSTRISAAAEGWRRYRALFALATEIPGREPVRLRLRHPDGAEFDASVARIEPGVIDDAAARRPADGSELAPGIVYFDLNGASSDALNAVMPALEHAKGIVFDLRGYPGDAGVELMRHLGREPVRSARWSVPVVTRPDREGWEWDESGWPVAPGEPMLDGEVAFLTDGRAISYAETIMGIVEAFKLGEIVGATTAGTNGNVNPFDLPGGFTVSWTGMKVLKHDGSQHHGVGIAPTVRAEPTARGIAEGRDEVLEKAVGVLQAKIAANSTQ